METNRKYTEEQDAFLREVIPGRLWHEVSALFEERFGFSLTKGQVKYAGLRLGVKSGATSHLMQKGTTIGQGTRFAVGNVPKQGRKFEVGHERTDKDGYTWVKVCESNRDPKAGNRQGKKCWRLKHHLVWEREHGREIPDGHAVIFANRDKQDFTPSNIVAVPRGVLSTMNALKLDYYDVETLQAAMTFARIRMKLKEKRKGAKDALRDNQQAQR